MYMVSIKLFFIGHNIDSLNDLYFFRKQDQFLAVEFFGELAVVYLRWKFLSA
ncbi:unnamed protein product, partial [Larinioides sclopetarius]